MLVYLYVREGRILHIFIEKEKILRHIRAKTISSSALEKHSFMRYYNSHLMFLCDAFFAW